MEPNTPNQPMENQMQASNSWFKGPKIIFLLLGIVVLGELIWGISKLLTPIPKPPSPARVVQKASDAQISLTASKSVLKVGDKVVVNVNVSTNRHSVSGVDLILKYDPKILQASSSSFIKSSIFPDYPLINVDNSKGIISISGVAGLNKKYFNGTGSFGSITFSAQALGQTSLDIQFTKGSTTDTNVFDAISNQDVLGKVSNVQLNVQ